MSRHQIDERQEEVLAEATVYGFGGAQTSRKARLTVEARPGEPEFIVTHELQQRVDDGLEWQEQESVVVEPTDTGSPEVIQPGYSEFPSVRVSCDWHDNAPRAYIRHKVSNGAEWRVETSWEIHPAMGITQIASKE